jgi:hypothetical protein
MTKSQYVGDGVTARRLRRLQEAIVSPRRTFLFTAIRERLMRALEELSSQINNELRDEVEQVLTQIVSDIEMLRGTESQMLAKNGDFLDKLSKVMAEMEAQMKSITEVTAVVKADAKEDGYLWD